MTHKNITRTIFLLLAALLIIAPAAAADTASIAENHHPMGWSISEIRLTIADILARADLSPIEKHHAQAEAIGADARLISWLESPRDSETGEIIYAENSGGLLRSIASFFGFGKTTHEQYTEEEGRAAWDAYHARYIAEYQPTGAFGEVIAYE